MLHPGLRELYVAVVNEDLFINHQFSSSKLNQLLYFGIMIIISTFLEK